jgi:hypothetical protein
LWIQQHENSEGTVYFWRTYLYGDTTIGTYNYKKLYRTSVHAWLYPPPPPPPFNHPINFLGGLREDVPAKKIYYYEADSGLEKLLYDFTLNIGDTAYTNFYGSMGDTVHYIVTDIDSVLVNTSYNKRLIIEPLPTSTLEAVAGNWIEGIGSEAGPLNYYITGFEYIHELVCFGVNNINKYSLATWPPAPECHFLVGIGEMEDNKISLVVSPNPTNGSLTLSLSCKDILTIEIADLSGKIILSQSKTEFSSTTIDLSGFAKGVYLVRLRDTNGNSVTKKIVKE